MQVDTDDAEVRGVIAFFPLSETFLRMNDKKHFFQRGHNSENKPVWTGKLVNIIETNRVEIRTDEYGLTLDFLQALCSSIFTLNKMIDDDILLFNDNLRTGNFLPIEF